MSSRIAWSWILVGVFAVVGGYYLALRSLWAVDASGEWVAWFARAAGGFAGGATIARHATVRPWREPLWAGALAMVIVAMVFPTLPTPWFYRAAEHGAHSWVMAGGCALVAATASAAGAAIGRRFTTPASTASLLVQSALLIAGCAAALNQLALVIVGVNATNALSAMIGIAVGGFLAQAVTPGRHTRACAGGCIAFLLIFIADRRTTTASSEMLTLWFGVGFMYVIAWVGARLAWTLIGKRRVVRPDVPTARVR